MMPSDVSDLQYNRCIRFAVQQMFVFAQILRNHVMVRIGGGWDTLENYLNRHDPCRCDASKSKCSCISNERMFY